LSNKLHEILGFVPDPPTLTGNDVSLLAFRNFDNLIGEEPMRLFMHRNRGFFAWRLD
jgi:hypothetical protein